MADRAAAETQLVVQQAQAEPEPQAKATTEEMVSSEQVAAEVVEPDLPDLGPHQEQALPTASRTFP
jgi:hypothetical protein